jgi:hypothetical protein
MNARQVTIWSDISYRRMTMAYCYAISVDFEQPTYTVGVLTDTHNSMVAELSATALAMLRAPVADDVVVFSDVTIEGYWPDRGGTLDLFLRAIRAAESRFALVKYADVDRKDEIYLACHAKSRKCASHVGKNAGLPSARPIKMRRWAKRMAQLEYQLPGIKF